MLAPEDHDSVCCKSFSLRNTTCVAPLQDTTYVPHIVGLRPPELKEYAVTSKCANSHHALAQNLLVGKPVALLSLYITYMYIYVSSAVHMTMVKIQLTCWRCVPKHASNLCIHVGTLT